MKNWKLGLIQVVLVVGAVGGYYVYQENQQMEAEETRRREASFQAIDAQRAVVKARLDAVCVPEAERVLKSMYGSRIVDRHGESQVMTSTGWRRNFSATVAGRTKRFFGTCFVDESYRLLDFRHTFE